MFTRKPVRKSGNLSALNHTVAINASRLALLAIFVKATAVTATLTVEGSWNSTDGVDGDWRQIAISPSNSTNLYTQVATIALTANPTISWTARVTPFTRVRVRVSTFTSATALEATLVGLNATV